MILQDQVPSSAETLLERIIRYINYPFIEQPGSFKVSIISLMLLVLLICLTGLLSRYVRGFLNRRILPRFNIEAGLQFTLLRLLHYLIIAFGVLYAMKIGFSIDLTNVAVLVGFLSVGIGFGLQYVASDIASGFILLFERPVRVGDWVSLDGGVEGRVENIRLRSTVVITNENMAVILPNSKLVQNRFINYSYSSQPVRINIPLDVDTTSDLDMVSQALLEAANSVKEVLTEPKPVVHFASFSETGPNLQLRVWINEPRDLSVIRSDVYFAIQRSFRKHDIKVPVRQLDLYVKSDARKTTSTGQG